MRAKKRFLSLLLCGALIVSLFPQVALAEEIDGMRDSGVTIGASGLCEHHEAHDESCGYTEGTTETPCAHEHSETCYVPVTECVHVHDEMCYPPEETADDTATPSDAEDRQPTACTHVCDEESGCIKEELNCPHDQGEHDDACGYAPATEGTPCGYVCEICHPKDSAPVCVCDTLCAEGSINAGCPVCGAEGADLAQCQGQPMDEQMAAVQEQINALPTVDELAAMSPEGQREVYDKLQAAYDAYEALPGEQKAEITGAEIFENLFGFFNGMVNALAVEGNYWELSWDENEGKVVSKEKPIPADAIEITENYFTEKGLTLTDGTYCVRGNVATNGRITISGTVHLILMDNSHLDASSGGIAVNGGADPVNSLSIYAQSVGDDMGRLTATTSTSSHPGIGGSIYPARTNGTITIHGGTVAARGGEGGAGIGGGGGGAGGTITIYGGEVTATGGRKASGIGGGESRGGGGTITIRGGTVQATSGSGGGAGIGGGNNGDGGEITISDGTVTATSQGLGAGIGGGAGGGGGTITISGGTVTAINSAEPSINARGAGIGGGTNGAGGTITISGGTITAIGGRYGGSGIGGGANYNGGMEDAGTFSTGTNGNAFINASSIQDNNSTSGWSGVIFGGEDDKDTGKVYGSPVELTTDAEIPAGKELVIESGQELKIGDDTTLTVNGKITNNGKIEGNGTIDGLGEITGSGSIGSSITDNRPTAPTITAHPSNQSVTAGQTATFTVAASGKPAPACQWQVSTDNGSTWTDVTNGTGGNTASYTTPTADMNMNGWQYHCVVENIKGTATSGAVTLTVSKIAQVISYGTTSLTKTYGDANFTNALTQTTVGGAISYTSSNTNVATVNSSTGEVTVVGVGSTTITATAAETTTHAQATASYSLTVNQAAQGAFSITGQPTGDIAYGQEFTLATSGGAGNGAVSWAVTSSPAYATVDNTGKVQITGVGSVTITATKTGGANYNDATATYTFTTVQATPTCTAPTGVTATYGQTLANVTLTNPTGNTEGTWSWVEADTTSVGSAGTQTHKATFTPTDSTNYKTVSGIDVTITVAQADPTCIAPNGVTATYGQTLGDIALTNPAGNTGGTWSWQNSTDLVGNVGTQNHKAKFTPTDSTNYKTVSGIDVAITVGKAAGPAAPTVTGSYAANSDFTKFIYTVDEITDAEYKMDNGQWQNNRVFSGIDPSSTHTFYARIKDDGNHEAGAAGNTGTVTFNKLDRNETPTLSYTVSGRTGSKVITIEAVNGCEYTFDGGTTWGSTNAQTFAQDTTQTIGIRYGMTDTHNASSGAMQEVSLVNLDQSAPAAFTLTFADNGDATFTATIPTVAGGEYSFDGTSWSSTNTKTDCLPNTEYTGYVRLAAKDGYNASPVTSDTQTTPRLLVADPEIEPDGGSFTGSQSVSIATSTPNATIYYTTDGSTPTTGSNEYTAPFTINSSTTVQAIAVRSGYENSGVVTAAFTKQPSGGSSGGGSSSDERSPAEESSTPTITPADPAKPDTSTNASTEITPSVEKDGKADVKIPSGDIDKAITAAQDAAKKNGNEKNGISVTVNITTKTTPEELTITIPAKSIRGLVNAKAKELRLKSELAWLTLDLPTLKQAQAMGGDMKIIITAVDNKTLSTEARAAIGGRPVYRFTVTVGGKPLTKFDGLVSIFIPYQPAATEKPGNLFLVYVDEKGNAEYMTGSSYDVQQKVVMGATTHFSVYGVGYQYDTQLFTDIKGHWAETSIQFVAARGLLSGTGNNQFSPNTGMTRGMFVTALGRLAGIDPGDYKNSKFIDVAADAYYAPYAAWAAEKGIVSGTTAVTFSPDSKITREQMAVIMANYAKAMGYTVPKTREAVTFADASSISTWAKDGVQAMQMAGVLAGKGNNRFDPTGTATRAEVATVLQRYVELVIDTNTAQGWDRNDSGKWMYYVDGKAATGKKTVDGTTYHFDAKGQLTKIEAIAPDTKKYITYKAKKGDTLWGIAQTYGCTVAEIVSLNEKLLTDPNAVLEGWSLKLPQK